MLFLIAALFSLQIAVTNHAFPVVNARTWNDRPESLSTFHQQLTTYLFSNSFPRYFLDS